jgi:hypothetical protein
MKQEEKGPTDYINIKRNLQSIKGKHHETKKKTERK